MTEAEFKSALMTIHSDMKRGLLTDEDFAHRMIVLVLTFCGH